MRHTRIKLNILSAVVLFSVSIGQTVNASNITHDDYVTSATAAKKSLATATEANYVWRDSEKILKQAEGLAKAGKYANAIVLANEAKHQGDMAFLQSKMQASEPQ